MSEVRSTIKYYGKEFTFWPDANGWKIDRNAFAIVLVNPDDEGVVCLGIEAAEMLAQKLQDEVEDFWQETRAFLAEEGAFDER